MTIDREKQTGNRLHDLNVEEVENGLNFINLTFVPLFSKGNNTIYFFTDEK